MSEGPGDDNKTEQPTQHRLDKAREEGNVLRAHSVAAAAVAVAGAAILSFAGGKLTELLELCLRRGLSVGGIGLQGPVPLLAAITAIVTPGVLVIAIFLIALTLVGFLADIAVGGWSFSVKPLTADFGRLNPMSGLRRLVSPAAFAELAKALVKFAAVAVIAYLAIRSRLPGFMQAAAENWPRATGHAALLWNQVFIVLAASLAALAALEVPYQVWSHRSRLKMTRQDLKDEMRELDGSPHTKRRIRALRRRLARMRMAAEVPKADVVVTNPEHYAAALQYRQTNMRAPRLVAKGTGLVAQRIREIAAQHRVPIIEAPPLARAICRYVELEDEIPAGLYPPVAEVLAYVYRLRAAEASGRRSPPMPRDQRFEPPPEFAA